MIRVQVETHVRTCDGHGHRHFGVSSKRTWFHHSLALIRRAVVEITPRGDDVPVETATGSGALRVRPAAGLNVSGVRAEQAGWWGVSSGLPWAVSLSSASKPPWIIPHVIIISRANQ